MDVEGEEVIRGGWSKVVDGQDDWEKIKNKFNDCAQKLTKWSKGKNVDCVKEILLKTEELKKMQDVEGPQNIAAIKDLQKELDILLEQEDLKWRQRAKVNWY
ncbi:uncharacterized protein LOC122282165 [Carya illinoinensis]|uniref:uncharacterized protein LOC122282165 n=1 Tax=Carya illinoinensis TaxID=32201 RepID=UPI001C71E308|nr:uncharacterized protein LOC122282165 [Carya illinoinensis]